MELRNHIQILILLIALFNFIQCSVLSVNVQTVTDLETQITGLSGYPPGSTVTINLAAGQYQLTKAINLTNSISNLILNGSLYSNGSIATTLLAPASGSKGHIWMGPGASFRPSHGIFNLIISGCLSTTTAPVSVLDATVTIDTVSFLNNLLAGS
ncbi:hypothetical protein HK096_010623, partial [Nowakowskiella sp. JEL0078]